MLFNGIWENDKTWDSSATWYNYPHFDIDIQVVGSVAINEGFEGVNVAIEATGLASFTVGETGIYAGLYEFKYYTAEIPSYTYKAYLAHSARGRTR